MKLYFAMLVPLLVASPCLAETIQLSRTSTLRIETDNARVITVSILYAGKLQESVRIGNSSFDARNIRFERFCEGCKNTYLIPLPDASSTYGAETFVVTSPEGESWTLQKLPFAKFAVKPAAKAYHSMLDDGSHQYEFRDGMLIRIKSGQVVE